MKKTVKITFEDNDAKKIKTTVTITNDMTLEIVFEPNIGKDETTYYMSYLNAFLNLFIGAEK
ncbi:MAG: hypothetical protein LBP63_11085 [Prevotellaceae bacterium]|jgi:hypothetical protein|nr:hypothetical protein [Prevotellaceae bacterium]